MLMTCEQIEKFLQGAIIEKMYTADCDLEGGQVIVFRKPKEMWGIYVMGYTELGNWVYLFHYGNSTEVIDTFYMKTLRKIMADNGFQIQIRG